MMMQIRDSANELAAELERLRTLDPLTRLHNRKAFSDALEACIASPSANDTAAVFYVETDNIKDLQNELSPEAMDAFVSDLAEMIRKSMAPADFAARISDNGFAILMARPTSAQLEKAGRELVSAYRSHIIDIGDRALSASCSMGMAAVGRLATSAPDIISLRTQGTCGSGGKRRSADCLQAAV